jgi:hypothetical protein
MAPTAAQVNEERCSVGAPPTGRQKSKGKLFDNHKVVLVNDFGVFNGVPESAG